MSSLVLGFQDIDQTKLTVVAGKGGNRRKDGQRIRVHGTEGDAEILSSS